MSGGLFRRASWSCADAGWQPAIQQAGQPALRKQGRRIRICSADSLVCCFAGCQPAGAERLKPDGYLQKNVRQAAADLPQVGNLCYGDGITDLCRQKDRAKARSFVMT